ALRECITVRVPFMNDCFRIGERSISQSATNPPGVLTIYADYAFDILLSITFDPAAPHKGELRSSAGHVFSRYYAYSHLGHYSLFPSSDSPNNPNNWCNALWEIRQKCGKDFTDSALFYTFKKMDDPHLP